MNLTNIDILLEVYKIMTVETREMNLNYAKFLEDGNANGESVVNPRALFGSVCSLKNDYKYMNQQDAPELFRYFIDGLIKGETAILKEKGLLAKESTNYKEAETITEKVYGTYQAQRVSCLHCNYISWTFHLSLDLNVDIDKESLKESRDRYAQEKDEARKLMDGEDATLEKSVKDGHYLLDKTKLDTTIDPVPYFDPAKDKLYCPFSKIAQPTIEDTYDLEELLDGFFHRELLNNVENYFTCRQCKDKGLIKQGDLKFITKTTFLYHPGPVLVITLKRFAKGRGYFGGYQKIDKFVKYPIKMDLGKYFLSS